MPAAATMARARCIWATSAEQAGAPEAAMRAEVALPVEGERMRKRKRGKQQREGGGSQDTD